MIILFAEFKIVLVSVLTFVWLIIIWILVLCYDCQITSLAFVRHVPTGGVGGWGVGGAEPSLFVKMWLFLIYLFICIEKYACKQFDPSTFCLIPPLCKTMVRLLVRNIKGLQHYTESGYVSERSRVGMCEKNLHHPSWLILLNDEKNG